MYPFNARPEVASERQPPLFQPAGKTSCGYLLGLLNRVKVLPPPQFSYWLLAQGVEHLVSARRVVLELSPRI